MALVVRVERHALVPRALAAFPVDGVHEILQHVPIGRAGHGLGSKALAMLSAMSHAPVRPSALNSLIASVFASKSLSAFR